MIRRSLIPAIAISVAAIVWFESGHARPRTVEEPRNATETRRHDRDAVVLEGTLEPLPAVTINASSMRLTVPLNSWVHEGQAVGEAAAQTAGGDIATCGQETSGVMGEGGRGLRLRSALLEESEARRELDSAEEAARAGALPRHGRC